MTPDILSSAVRSLLLGVALTAVSACGITNMLAEEGPEGHDQAITMEPIQQMVPERPAAVAGSLDRASETVSQIAAWDLAGLRIGMNVDEVSDEMLWRGYKNDQGAIWKRSDDRVVVEFGAKGLQRALSTLLLPEEDTARREAAQTCSAIGAIGGKSECEVESGGVRYEVIIASGEDGWKLMKIMEARSVDTASAAD